VFRTNKLTGLTFDVGEIASPGFFGEMSLFDEHPRSATVQALDHCYLFHIHRDSFFKFLGRSGELKLRFYQACIKTMVTRVRELDENHVVNQYQLWKMALRKDVAS
jgi:CRP-like cAMP-binding protein